MKKRINDENQSRSIDSFVPMEHIFDWCHICCFTFIIDIYVTAAVSGTKYSGKSAASDLMVTFAFVVVIE